MFEDAHMNDGDEVVVMRAEMSPISLQTMTKFDEDEHVCGTRSM